MKQVYTNLPETTSSSNLSILDIVHTVDLRDIEYYVRKKYIGQMEHPTTDAMQLAEVQILCDKFKVDGYDVLDVAELTTRVYENAKKEYDDRLKKETAKLRHEVSVLSKKLSQLEKEANNG